jgi:hypothetical protein
MTANLALPKVIAEIARVAGADAAWALVREKGGTSIYVPPQVEADHWLALLIGIEAAQKLCLYYRDPTADQTFLGRRIAIPLASSSQKSAAWLQVLDGGLSLAETARLMGVDQRTVSYRRARHAKPGKRRPGQGEMF